MDQELCHAALVELGQRIEACGASVELTHAVILCSDLRRAIGNQFNAPDKLAEQRVRDALACAHHWISNSGHGGEPDFRPNRQMSAEPMMHVVCQKCLARTWFTEKQWRDIPATNLRGGGLATA